MSELLLIGTLILGVIAIGLFVRMYEDHNKKSKDIKE